MLKQTFIVLCTVAILIIVFSATKTRKLAVDKGEIDKCLELEKLAAENPDVSPEVFELLEKCNQERAERLGLDKPGTGFLGNTPEHPDGALAHYESQGGIHYFTVYEDRIEINVSLGTPSGEKELLFTDIEKIEKAWDVPGTINVIMKGSGVMRQSYSLTLFGGTEAIRPEGTRDLDRLFDLLQKKLSEAS